MKAVITFLLSILVCSSFVGCDVRTPDYAINVGTELQLIDEESVKVISAELTEGLISITLEINFETITLSDFEYITVRKSEDGSPEIKCDISASRKQNDSEFFDAPYKGKVTLVFYGEGISATDNLSAYLLHMGYCKEDGTMPHGKFLLM